jgi:sortase (surface protein transpeptidase)
MQPLSRLLRFAALPAAFLVPGIFVGAIIASQATPPRSSIVAAALEDVQPTTTTASLPAPAVSSSRGADLQPTPPPTPPAATPTPGAPLPSRTEASSYPPNRLIIPSLGIDSPWLSLGWLPNGITMDSPPGPQDLGWYTFTAQPGSAGNAVFSGHVDWHTGAPALFAHLDSLHTGDEVDVSRGDRTLVRYYVTSSQWYPLYGTPAAPIIAPTTQPTVTLITCGGTFDSSTHEYDQRLIVRAVASSSH